MPRARRLLGRPGDGRPSRQSRAFGCARDVRSPRSRPPIRLDAAVKPHRRLESDRPGARSGEPLRSERTVLWKPVGPRTTSSRTATAIGSARQDRGVGVQKHLLQTRGSSAGWNVGRTMALSPATLGGRRDRRIRRSRPRSRWERSPRGGRGTGPIPGAESVVSAVGRPSTIQGPNVAEEGRSWCQAVPASGNAGGRIGIVRPKIGWTLAEIALISECMPARSTRRRRRTSPAARPPPRSARLVHPAAFRCEVVRGFAAENLEAALRRGLALRNESRASSAASISSARPIATSRSTRADEHAAHRAGSRREAAQGEGRRFRTRQPFSGGSGRTRAPEGRHVHRWPDQVGHRAGGAAAGNRREVPGSLRSLFAAISESSSATSSSRLGGAARTESAPFLPRIFESRLISLPPELGVDRSNGEQAQRSPPGGGGEGPDLDRQIGSFRMECQGR